MSPRISLVTLLLLVAAAPRYDDHQDLLHYIAADGNKQPVKTADDWRIRRGHVLDAFQLVAGKLPDRSKLPPLEVKVEEEDRVEGVIRRKISYASDGTERVMAYLLLPDQDAAQKRPAVLCLHQTTAIGKREPAGLGPKTDLHYAVHLAQRGYITLAPDYPTLGESKFDLKNNPQYTSTTMKAIVDNIRALDLLTAMPQVDAGRIGAIGHSLGGHNAIFTAVMDDRIKVIVTNCAFTRFAKYKKGNLAGWAGHRYMPKIASDYANDPAGMPFDFTELVGCLAPRPFLAIAPLRDDNFEVSGIKDCIEAALPIYQLLGHQPRLRGEYPDLAHEFPESSRTLAYEFLHQHLKDSR